VTRLCSTHLVSANTVTGIPTGKLFVSLRALLSPDMSLRVIRFPALPMRDVVKVMPINGEVIDRGR
jgi:hypothetical protein